jgi:zinc transporter ZupT
MAFHHHAGSRRQQNNHHDDNDDDTDWTTPLLLSTLAGLSTCLGAAIVFCMQRQRHGNKPRNGKRGGGDSGGLGHEHLAFALSLAGSVMITVSVASILPECFAVDDDDNIGVQDTSATGTTATGTSGPSLAANRIPSILHHYTPIGSPLFWERCIAFGIGCALYLLLSKCAFPEPDAVLGLTTSCDNSTDHHHSQVQLHMASSSSPQLVQSFDESTTVPLSSSSRTIHNKTTTDHNSTGTTTTTTTLFRTAAAQHRIGTTHRRHRSTPDDAELLPFLTTSNGAFLVHEESKNINTSSGLVLTTDADSVQGGTSSTGTAPQHEERSLVPCESLKKASQRRVCSGGNFLGRASIRQCLHWMRGNDLTSAAAAAAMTVPLGSTSHNPSLDGTTAAAAALEARRAWRVAMLLFVSLTVHNFPEGLAVAASSLQSARLGWTTTVAIALHNIPEGIAIAIPCLAARPDAPWLAFGLASASGLAEPLGAAVALLVLRGGGGDRRRGRRQPQQPVRVGHEDDNTIGAKNISAVVASATILDDAASDKLSVFWNAVLDMKNVLAFVAGIMIAVALVELFPEARRHVQTRTARWSFVAGTLTGVLVMLASDAYLES